MIGERLTQLRLARNLTLDELSAKMGGIVTKQALSKYEQNQSQPSALVLTKLSAALGVKASYFIASSPIKVDFIAYRSTTVLPEREKARVKSVVTHCLEDRVWLQTLIGQTEKGNIPWNTMPISSLEDTETQADNLRRLWDLGSSPISSITETLEEHQLCVLSIDADEKFDGISAIGRDVTTDEILGGAIVSRRDVAGERQRFNLIHELGHLVLKIPPGIKEEQAAFRFAGAFLVPAERLIKEVGSKRSYIYISELLMLKRKFGVSIQALIRRMWDLGIINDSYYKRWNVYINKTGWKKHEPEELAGETPKWFERNISRLLGEGAISKDDAERVLGSTIDVNEPSNLMRRRAFLKLPIEKRRQLLEQQAKALFDYYENEAEILTAEDGIYDY